MPSETMPPPGRVSNALGMNPTDGDRVGNRLPACDQSNPADLEAWYGGFGYDQHFRKIVLANCREIVRAQGLATGEKLSEARIDDKARVSDTYIDFIITNLNGRRLREQNAIESTRTGA